jgi:hypothetical protein
VERPRTPPPSVTRLSVRIFHELYRLRTDLERAVEAVGLRLYETSWIVRVTKTLKLDYSLMF